MSVYTIGDLHLSFGSNKPMDIFGVTWKNHSEKIFNNWQSTVKESDTVILCGDSSWAMDYKSLEPDFSFIHKLNGKKLILKGNHDYWWGTLSKINGFLKENGFDSIGILHNNSYNADGINICGTRGWPCDEKNEGEFDNRILAREVGRLKLSLERVLKPQEETVVFLHYPPIYEGFRCAEIIDVLKEYKIKRCYYGHLHDVSVKKAIQGLQEGIEFRLVSCDYTEFAPVKITD